MSPYDLCHRFGDARNKAGVAEFTNWWVVGDSKLLKLVVSVEFDVPAELGKLFCQSSFHEMNRSFVHTKFLLEDMSIREPL